MNKVLIYGIGALGEENLNIIRQGLSDRYNVIGYMDTYYQKKFYQYKKVFKVEELKEIDYDYIVINAYSQASDDEIYRFLLENGVRKEKIVRYAKYAFYDHEFPFRHIENRVEVLRNLTEEIPYEGILFGMSYAEIGIDVNQLSRNILNLAHPAFDLFYHRLTIESVFQTKIKLENIRYIILELPYYIFNFDLSLCGSGLFQSSMNYIFHWQNWHHFTEKEENREFIEGFPIFQDMFLRDSRGNSSMVENRRTMTDYQFTEKDIKEHVVSHTIKKYHDATVEENQFIFQDILKMIGEKLPGVKLLILICPQPSVIRKLYEEYPAQKQVFEEEMKSTKAMYPNLAILDEQALFTNHDEYFSDTYGHLNRKGCDVLTRYLDKILKELM